MSQDPILGENITIPEGHLLLNENELSRAMYFIRSGKVRVFKTYHGRKVTLAMLGPGEVFGEMSFFDSKPRSASVEALTSLSLLVIKDGVGAQQLSKLPEWVSPVFKVMAARLREANAHLASLKSLAEFQKDTQGINRLASSMYTETRRFLNILKLFLAGNAATMEHDDVRARLDNLVGPRMVRLDVFYKLLFVHHLLTLEGDVHTGHVRFNEQLNHDFEAYLDSEIASERYLLLTESAYAVLGRIAEILELEKKQGTSLS
ncbi:MAG: cyclic nucleotide-binding domain-containing protein, partial [Bdellovibrionales bacterium]|nr:cyclic nucleotide-binding domain-containing protein [Bdellovibrionales bacterium]